MHIMETKSDNDESIRVPYPMVLDYHGEKFNGRNFVSSIYKF